MSYTDFLGIGYISTSPLKSPLFVYVGILSTAWVQLRWTM